MPAIRLEPEKGAEVERGEITEGCIRQKGLVHLQLRRFAIRAVVSGLAAIMNNRLESP
jgi:hypothetical protein